MHGYIRSNKSPFSLCRFGHTSNYKCWPYTPCRSEAAGGAQDGYRLSPAQTLLTYPFAIDCGMLRGVAYCFVMDRTGILVRVSNQITRTHILLVIGPFKTYSPINLGCCELKQIGNHAPWASQRSGFSQLSWFPPASKYIRLRSVAAMAHQLKSFANSHRHWIGEWNTWHTGQYAVANGQQWL